MAVFNRSNRSTGTLVVVALSDLQHLVYRVILWVLLTDTMSLLQSKNQDQDQNDGPGEAKSMDEVAEGILSVTPGSFSPNHSSSEVRTLHDEKEIPSSYDPEEGVIKLTGKYAKYAGEAPDGGLKAWSVILACVSLHITFCPRC